MELDELNKQIDSQVASGTFMDNRTNVQNNGDNVSLSTSTEEPLNNKDRLGVVEAVGVDKIKKKTPHFCGVKKMEKLYLFLN